MGRMDRLLSMVGRKWKVYRSNFHLREDGWYIVYAGSHKDKPAERLGAAENLPLYAQQAYTELQRYYEEEAARKAINRQRHEEERLAAIQRRAEKRERHLERVASDRLTKHLKKAAAAKQLPKEQIRELRTQRLLAGIAEKKEQMALLGNKRSKKLSVGRRRALIETGGRCVYCNGAPGYDKLTIEHLLPRSLGGSNAYENLTAACKTCNNRRGNQEEFIHLVCERWRPFVLWKLGGCVGPEFTIEGSKFHIPTHEQHI